MISVSTEAFREPSAIPQTLHHVSVEHVGLQTCYLHRVDCPKDESKGSQRAEELGDTVTLGLDHCEKLAKFNCCDIRDLLLEPWTATCQMTNRYAIQAMAYHPHFWTVCSWP